MMAFIGPFRWMARGVCYGGGGGSSQVKETAAQKASAEVAMKNYNDYMSTIMPVQKEFIADVTADPTNRENLVTGQANANIAQKVGTPSIDPNAGMSSASTVGLANTMSDAQIKGRQAVDTQRLTGEQAIVDLGMGENSTAQLGLSDLASQSVKQSINNQQSSQYSADADMSAAASGLGAAAGMATNIYNKYY